VVERSPADLITRRTPPRHLPRWLSVEDILKLIHAAEDNVVYAALVEFMWATGCRVSEVTGARVENIDWQNCSIKVLGKGDKERLSPLAQKTIAALKKYLNAFPHIGKTGFLFRRVLPVQLGCVHLYKGQYWVASWSENRVSPIGTVQRVLRSGHIGVLVSGKRSGPKPKFDPTITLATNLHTAGRQWSEIFDAISPNTSLTLRQQKTIQSAVYRRIHGPKQSTARALEQITKYDDARAKAHELVSASRLPHNSGS
jgi:integrase